MQQEMDWASMKGGKRENIELRIIGSGRFACAIQESQFMTVTAWVVKCVCGERGFVWRKIHLDKFKVKLNSLQMDGY